MGTKPKSCPRGFSRGGNRAGRRCFSQRPQVRLKRQQARTQMALRGQEVITARMFVVCSHPHLATWFKPLGGG